MNGNVLIKIIISALSSAHHTRAHMFRCTVRNLCRFNRWIHSEGRIVTYIHIHICMHIHLHIHIHSNTYRNNTHCGSGVGRKYFSASSKPDIVIPVPYVRYECCTHVQPYRLFCFI